ncbi:MAG TPA: hypothetical protein VGJ86_16385 [Acidimicrobiales bacterium]
MGRLRAGRYLVASVVLAAACSGGGDSSGSPPDRTTTTVAVPGSDWEVQSPEDQGMDPALLQQAHDYAFADGMNTQGVVVAHDGVIVAEWYAPAPTRTRGLPAGPWPRASPAP